LVGGGDDMGAAGQEEPKVPEVGEAGWLRLTLIWDLLGDMR
jgi:hypothetical protein